MRHSRATTRGERRQAKRNKRNRMKVDSKSVFIIQQAQIKRAEQSKARGGTDD